jgi:UDPglucose 6-dehydrogenase
MATEDFAMIGFVGLSHLGLTTGISIASRGFDVLGFDPDPALISNLQARKLPVFEPKLDDLLASSQEKGKTHFTSNVRDLSACDLVYIAIDVKTDQNNQSDLGPLRALIVEACAYMKKGTTLVIHSQVPPGFCRELNEALRKLDITLFYQVEVLIFGRAVERVLEPERYIVGSSDPGAPLPESYAKLLGHFACPILNMRYESAELCKISINMFLISSVSMSNQLGELSEKIGADWNEIAAALRLDRRIGPYAYLSPGLGISGGNLERDMATVIRLGRETGADVTLSETLSRDSQYRRDWVLRKLHAEVLSQTEKPMVALWGLAYKANTKSIKNSPSIQLLSDLQGVSVQAYDPEVESTALGPKVKQVSSAREASSGADVLVVMTPWSEFGTAPIREVLAGMRKRVIIDPFGVLQGREREFTVGTRYIRLGKAEAVYDQSSV